MVWKQASLESKAVPTRLDRAPEANSGHFHLLLHVYFAPVSCWLWACTLLPAIRSWKQGFGAGLNAGPDLKTRYSKSLHFLHVNHLRPFQLPLAYTAYSMYMPCLSFFWINRKTLSFMHNQHFFISNGLALPVAACRLFLRLSPTAMLGVVRDGGWRAGQCVH